MLSVTVHNEPDLVSFKLKGEMIQGALDEFRAYYRLLSIFPREKCVVVDLSGVEKIDEAGKELLAKMSHDGAEFVLNERSHSFDEILNLLAPAAPKIESRTAATVVREQKVALAFKRILFATDLSASSLAALPYAEIIAKRYHAQLLLAHVIPSEAFSHIPVQLRDDVLKQSRAAVSAQLSDAAASLRDVSHEVVVDHGDVVPVLSELAKRKEVGLVILGTHGRRGVEKLWLGSVAEEIFRFSERPVLTVGPQVHPPDDGSLRRILYATDFSQSSLRAMDYAFSLAQEHRARLLFLHVSQSMAEEPVGVRVRALDIIQQRLRDLGMNRAPADVDTKVLVEFGGIADRILEVVHREHADLVVLGIRSGSGLLTRIAPHLPGLTAYRVVTEAPCPVLTVRGPAQSASRAEGEDKAA